MTEECSKYGAVAAIEIPHVGGPAAGVGFVFVKYSTMEDAAKVKRHRVLKKNRGKRRTERMKIDVDHCVCVAARLHYQRCNFNR